MNDVRLVYTYCLLDGAGDVRAFEFEACGDDREALERTGEVLARHPGRAGVEVLRGNALVCRRSDRTA